MGWIWCVRCEKSRRHFVARTFALITPVHPILHRVSCSYEMIPNAPKHYETHQNMSLGSNGVDQVHCWEKLQRDFVAQTFTLIAPVQYVLQQVSCSYETIPNAPKYYETDRKLVYRLMGWIGCIRCEKSHRDFVARAFALIALVHPNIASSFMRLRKDPKCAQTLCNAPKHEFRVQWSGLGAFVAKKIPT